MSNNQLLKAKDIRILWNCGRGDDCPKIKELIVVEFKREDYGKWPLHLYKHYDNDTGNCFAGWSKNVTANLLAEIIILSINYGFVDEKAEDSAFREFRKIEEVKEVIDLVFMGGMGGRAMSGDLMEEEDTK